MTQLLDASGKTLLGYQAMMGEAGLVTMKLNGDQPPSFYFSNLNGEYKASLGAVDERTGKQVLILGLPQASTGQQTSKAQQAIKEFLLNAYQIQFNGLVPAIIIALAGGMTNGNAMITLQWNSDRSKVESYQFNATIKPNDQARPQTLPVTARYGTDGRTLQYSIAGVSRIFNAVLGEINANGRQTVRMAFIRTPDGGQLSAFEQAVNSFLMNAYQIQLNGIVPGIIIALSGMATGEAVVTLQWNTERTKVASFHFATVQKGDGQPQTLSVTARYGRDEKTLVYSVPGLSASFSASMGAMSRDGQQTARLAFVQTAAGAKPSALEQAMDAFLTSAYQIQFSGVIPGFVIAAAGSLGGNVSIALQWNASRTAILRFAFDVKGIYATQPQGTLPAVTRISSGFVIQGPEDAITHVVYDVQNRTLSDAASGRVLVSAETIATGISIIGRSEGAVFKLNLNQNLGSGGIGLATMFAHGLTASGFGKLVRIDWMDGNAGYGITATPASVTGNTVYQLYQLTGSKLDLQREQTAWSVFGNYYGFNMAGVQFTGSDGKSLSIRAVVANATGNVLAATTSMNSQVLNAMATFTEGGNAAQLRQLINQAGNFAGQTLQVLEYKDGHWSRTTVMDLFAGATSLRGRGNVPVTEYGARIVEAFGKNGRFMYAANAATPETLSTSLAAGEKFKTDYKSLFDLGENLNYASIQYSAKDHNISLGFMFEKGKITQLSIDTRYAFREDKAAGTVTITDTWNAAAEPQTLKYGDLAKQASRVEGPTEIFARALGVSENLITNLSRVGLIQTGMTVDAATGERIGGFGGIHSFLQWRAYTSAMKDGMTTVMEQIHFMGVNPENGQIADGKVCELSYFIRGSVSLDSRQDILMAQNWDVLKDVSLGITVTRPFEGQNRFALGGNASVKLIEAGPYEAAGFTFGSQGISIYVQKGTTATVLDSYRSGLQVDLTSETRASFAYGRWESLTTTEKWAYGIGSVVIVAAAVAAVVFSGGLAAFGIGGAGATAAGTAAAGTTGLTLLGITATTVTAKVALTVAVAGLYSAVGFGVTGFVYQQYQGGSNALSQMFYINSAVAGTISAVAFTGGLLTGALVPTALLPAAVTGIATAEGAKIGIGMTILAYMNAISTATMGAMGGHFALTGADLQDTAWGKTLNVVGYGVYAGIGAAGFSLVRGILTAVRTAWLTELRAVAITVVKQGAPERLALAGLEGQTLTFKAISNLLTRSQLAGAMALTLRNGLIYFPKAVFGFMINGIKGIFAPAGSTASWGAAAAEAGHATVAVMAFSSIFAGLTVALIGKLVGNEQAVKFGLGIAILGITAMAVGGLTRSILKNAATIVKSIGGEASMLATRQVLSRGTMIFMAKANAVMKLFMVGAGAMAVTGFALKLIAPSSVLATGMQKWGLIGLGALVAGRLAIFFLGNPFIMWKAGTGLGALGSLVSWIGFSVGLYGVMTGNQDATAWGARIMVLGMALQAVAGFRIMSEAQAGQSPLLHRYLGLQIGAKGATVLRSYAENFTRAFWQQAGSSIIFFRSFPVTQALFGVNHLTDYVLSLFDVDPVLAVNPETKKVETYFEHLERLFFENWSLTGKGSLSDTERLVHDIVLGQLLHVFGASYSGTGLMGRWSESQGGFFKGILNYVSPASYGRYFGAGAARQGLGRSLFGYMDNMLLFNAFMAPVTAANRALNPDAVGGEASPLQQLMQLPGTMMNYLTMPLGLAAAIYGGEKGRAKFAAELEQYILFLVPQARQPFTAMMFQAKYGEMFSSGRETFEAMSHEQRQLLAYVWQEGGIKMEGGKMLLAEHLLLGRDLKDVKLTTEQLKAAMKLDISRFNFDEVISSVATLSGLRMFGINIQVAKEAPATEKAPAEGEKLGTVEAPAQPKVPELAEKVPAAIARTLSEFKLSFDAPNDLVREFLTDMNVAGMLAERSLGVNGSEFIENFMRSPETSIQRFVSSIDAQSRFGHFSKLALDPGLKGTEARDQVLRAYSELMNRREKSPDQQGAPKTVREVLENAGILDASLEGLLGKELLNTRLSDAEVPIARAMLFIYEISNLPSPSTICDITAAKDLKADSTLTPHKVTIEAETRLEAERQLAVRSTPESKNTIDVVRIVKPAKAEAETAAEPGKSPAREMVFEGLAIRLADGKTFAFLSFEALNAMRGLTGPEGSVLFEYLGAEWRSQAFDTLRNKIIEEGPEKSDPALHEANLRSLDRLLTISNADAVRMFGSAEEIVATFRFWSLQDVLVPKIEKLRNEQKPALKGLEAEMAKPEAKRDQAKIDAFKKIIAKTGIPLVELERKLADAGMEAAGKNTALGKIVLFADAAGITIDFTKPFELQVLSDIFLGFTAKDPAQLRAWIRQALRGEIKDIKTADILYAIRRGLIDVLQGTLESGLLRNYIDAVKSHEPQKIRDARDAIRKLFSENRDLVGLKSLLKETSLSNLGDRTRTKIDKATLSQNAADVTERFTNYMFETVLMEFICANGQKIIKDGQDIGGLLGTGETYLSDGRIDEIGGVPNTVDRSPTDLIGRGASHFLIAVGIDMGFDVSAATGIGKSRGQILGTSFFNSNRHLNQGLEKGRVALAVEDQASARKFFDDKAEFNEFTHNELAQGLGLELVDGANYIGNGKNNYNGLQLKLRENENSVFVTDILSRTHIFNNIDDVSGRSLLNFLERNFGRTVLDEAQFAAFSRVEAIIASGSRPPPAGEKRVLQVMEFVQKIQQLFDGPGKDGKQIQRIYSEKEFIEAAKGEGEQGRLLFFVDELTGQVVFNNALYKLLGEMGKDHGLELYREFSSVFLALFGEGTRMSLTVDPTTHKVTMKPADNKTINKDQQSSDVPYQIAFLFRSLKKLAEDGMLDKGKTIRDHALAKDIDARDSLRDMPFAGFDEAGMITNMEAFMKWFDVDGIGKLNTKMGTPVQANFVRGAVALTATMPEYIQLFTGNRLLELGKSSPDLSYQSAAKRLKLALYKDKESFIEAVMEHIQSVAQKVGAEGAKDHLFFIINKTEHRNWIKQAIEKIQRGEGGREAKTLIDSILGQSQKIREINQYTDAAEINAIRAATLVKNGSVVPLIIIATERAGTGFDLKRTEVKDGMPTENDGQNTAPALTLDGRTHIFAFDVQNYASHFLAQVIGRDRSNSGQIRLFADREAILTTLTKAIDGPGYKGFIKSLEGARQKAQESLDYVRTRTGVDAAWKAEQIKLYEARVNSFDSLIKLAGEFNGKKENIRAFFEKVLNSKEGMALAELTGGKGDTTLVTIETLFSLGAEYREAEHQSAGARAVVGIYLQARLIMQGLCTLLERFSFDPALKTELQKVISEIKEGKIIDQRVELKEGIEDGTTFTRNQIQMIINQIFGTRLEGQSGERNKTGSLIERLMQTGLGETFLNAIFERSALMKIESHLRGERIQDDLKFDNIEREANSLTSGEFGKYSIARQQNGEVRDFIKTILRFSPYILDSHETRSPGTAQAERYQAHVADRQNRPDASRADMVKNENTTGTLVERVVDYLTRQGEINPNGQTSRARIAQAFLVALGGNLQGASLAALRPALAAVQQLATHFNVASMVNLSEQDPNALKRDLAALEMLGAAVQNFDSTNVEQLHSAMLGATIVLHKLELFNSNQSERFAETLGLIGDTMMLAGARTMDANDITAILVSSNPAAELARWQIQNGVRNPNFDDSVLVRKAQREEASTLRKMHQSQAVREAENKMYQALGYNRTGKVNKLMTGAVIKYQWLKGIYGDPSAMPGESKFNKASLFPLSVALLFGVAGGIFAGVAVGALMAVVAGAAMFAPRWINTSVLAQIGTTLRDEKIAPRFGWPSSWSRPLVMKDWINNDGTLKTGFFEALRRSGVTLSVDDEARIRQVIPLLAQDGILGMNKLERLTFAQFVKFAKSFDKQSAQFLPQTAAENQRLAKNSWNESLGFRHWRKTAASWLAAKEVKAPDSLIGKVYTKLRPALRVVVESKWLSASLLVTGVVCAVFLPGLGAVGVLLAGTGKVLAGVGALALVANPVLREPVAEAQLLQFKEQTGDKAILKTIDRMIALHPRDVPSGLQKLIDAQPGTIPALKLQKAQLDALIKALGGEKSPPAAEFVEQRKELEGILTKRQALLDDALPTLNAEDLKFFKLQRFLEDKKVELGLQGIPILELMENLTKFGYAAGDMATLGAVLRVIDPEMSPISNKLLAAALNRGGHILTKELKHLALAELWVAKFQANNPGQMLSAEQFRNMAEELEWLSPEMRDVFAAHIGFTGEQLPLSIFRQNFDEATALLKAGNTEGAKPFLVALEQENRAHGYVYALKLTALKNAFIDKIEGISVVDTKRIKQIMRDNIAKAKRLLDTKASVLTPEEQGRMRAGIEAQEKLIERIEIAPDMDTMAMMSGTKMKFSLAQLVEKVNLMESLGYSEAEVNANIFIYINHETMESDLNNFALPYFEHRIQKLQKERKTVSDGSEDAKRIDREMADLKKGKTWIKKDGSDAQGQAYRDYFAEEFSSLFVKMLPRTERETVFRGLKVMSAYESELLVRKMAIYEAVSLDTTTPQQRIAAGSENKMKIDKLEQELESGQETLAGGKTQALTPASRSKKLTELLDSYRAVFGKQDAYFSQTPVFNWFYQWLEAVRTGNKALADKIAIAKYNENFDPKKAGSAEKVLTEEELKELLEVTKSKDPIVIQEAAVRFMRSWVTSLSILLEAYSKKAEMQREMKDAAVTPEDSPAAKLMADVHQRISQALSGKIKLNEGGDAGNEEGALKWFTGLLIERLTPEQLASGDLGDKFILDAVMKLAAALGYPPINPTAVIYEDAQTQLLVESDQFGGRHAVYASVSDLNDPDKTMQIIRIRNVPHIPLTPINKGKDEISIEDLAQFVEHNVPILGLFWQRIRDAAFSARPAQPAAQRSELRLEMALVAPVTATPVVPGYDVKMAEARTVAQGIVSQLTDMQLYGLDRAGLMRGLDPQTGVLMRVATTERDKQLLGNRSAFARKTAEGRQEIVLNQEVVDRSSVQELKDILIHEVVHTLQPAEMLEEARRLDAEMQAYLVTVEVMEEGIVKEKIRALLAIIQEGRQSNPTVSRDVIQLVENIIMATVDASGIETLLNRVQSEVIIYKDAKAFGAIGGLKHAGTPEDLRSQALRFPNKQHGSILVSDAALREDGERLSGVLDELVKAGFSVFIYNEADVGTNAPKFFWTGQIAAWLGKSEFVTMMKAVPDAVQGRFFSMEACLSNTLISRLIDEIVARQQVAVAA
ncbi:MAG: hypothetical protein ABH891_01575 [Candidatus Omnitrophota bacterium]